MKTVLLVASLLAFCQADDDTFLMEKKGGLKNYCGGDLRQVLMLICESVYKRSSSDGSLGQEDWPLRLMGLEELEDAMFPFRSRAKALAVLPAHFRRQSRGVADECCHKACTIEELNSYCGVKPSSVVSI